jgi:hypothetical protein
MFQLPPPDLQVRFALALIEARSLVLQDALKETVKTLDVEAIDKQLAKHAPKPGLRALAARGLRGELLFSVPAVLEATPRLLGYYRLLLGYSQKLFYTSETGMGRFRSMEERGTLTPKNLPDLPAVCDHLCEAAGMLLAGVGASTVTASLLDDLTLLTLGPQLRGSANNDIGADGIGVVFGIIREIVKGAVTAEDTEHLKLINAAGRTVMISIAADPDIKIEETMAAGAGSLKRVAIEVKGGRDISNIHNRLGEANKSHEKARVEGFPECWTVVNVDRMDIKAARVASPATNHFYRFSELLDQNSAAYKDFAGRIEGLTGVKHK